MDGATTGTIIIATITAGIITTTRPPALRGRPASASRPSSYMRATP
jgi:hypothetical protein